MVIFLTACGVNVNSESEIEKYNTYQEQMDTFITDYITGKITENEMIAFLDDFEGFVEESSLDDKAKEHQLNAIQLYREGIQAGNDEEKIEEAAYENHLAVLKIQEAQ